MSPEKPASPAPLSAERQAYLRQVLFRRRLVHFCQAGLLLGFVALWELLALAYFEAYHTDPSVSPEFLTRSAECFTRVLELGVVKDYLYSNLYTIYYEQGEYDLAEQALQDYEAAFPQDYMPHALRGMLLITIENQDPQLARNYAPALEEYERAGELIRSEDDATYYQQLGSLIQQLRDNGWL